jgi:biotin synthase-like enzyme
MNLNSVPPELIGILQSSTISEADKASIDSFFANLDSAKRPDIMREVRSRGNWQDKIKFCLEQAKAAGY